MGGGVEEGGRFGEDEGDVEEEAEEEAGREELPLAEGGSAVDARDLTLVVFKACVRDSEMFDRGFVTSFSKMVAKSAGALSEAMLARAVDRGVEVLVYAAIWNPTLFAICSSEGPAGSSSVLKANEKYAQGTPSLVKQSTNSLTRLVLPHPATPWSHASWLT